MDNLNINDSFQKLLDHSFRVYKGIRFEITKDGWCRNGVLCKTEKEMDDLINLGTNAIKKSIKHG